jgi:hypothetical protein
MGSALMASARAHAGAAVVEPTAQTVTGTYPGRISSIRDNGVYVLLPDFHPEQEFGPCVIPIGVQGVGPSTVAAGKVVFTNGTALIKGLLVLVNVPVRGAPWILAIAPTGPGV